MNKKAQWDKVKNFFQPKPQLNNPQVINQAMQDMVTKAQKLYQTFQSIFSNPENGEIYKQYLGAYDSTFKNLYQQLSNFSMSASSLLPTNQGMQAFNGWTREEFNNYQATGQIPQRLQQQAKTKITIRIADTVNQTPGTVDTAEIRLSENFRIQLNDFLDSVWNLKSVFPQYQRIANEIKEFGDNFLNDKEKVDNNMEKIKMRNSQDLNKIIRIARELDEKGNHKRADKIDQIMIRISQYTSPVESAKLYMQNTTIPELLGNAKALHNKTVYTTLLQNIQNFANLLHISVKVQDHSYDPLGGAYNQNDLLTDVYNFLQKIYTGLEYLKSSDKTNIQVYNQANVFLDNITNFLQTNKQQLTEFVDEKKNNDQQKIDLLKQQLLVLNEKAKSDTTIKAQLDKYMQVLQSSNYPIAKEAVQQLQKLLQNESIKNEYYKDVKPYQTFYQKLVDGEFGRDYPPSQAIQMTLNRAHEVGQSPAFIEFLKEQLS